MLQDIENGKDNVDFVLVFKLSRFGQNAAVEEVIRKLVNNEKFKAEIQKHIGNSIDTEELDREHAGLQDRLKQETGAKNKLANQMDNLSVSDKHYDKNRCYL